MKHKKVVTIGNQKEVDISLDGRMEFLLSKVIEPTIKDLCSSFCIDNKAMFDLLYETYGLRMRLVEELSGSGDGYDKPSYYEDKAFDNLCFKRIQNIANQFVGSDGKCKIEGLELNKERIYDSIMYEEMVRLNEKYLFQFYDVEQFDGDYEKMIQRMPIFPAGDSARDFTYRTKREENFTVFEAILYCTILCSTPKQSIKTLNKELRRKRDYDREERWFSKFSEAFFSDELRDAIIYIVIDNAYSRLEEFRNLIINPREAPKKRGRKKKKTYDEAEREKRNKENKDHLDSYILMPYEDSIGVLIIAEFIALRIFPIQFPAKEIGEELKDGPDEGTEEYDMKKREITFDIFSGYIEEAPNLTKAEKEYIKSQSDLGMITEEDYSYALLVSESFLIFIEEVMQIAAKLLGCLPKSVMVENKEKIYQYLQKI